MSDPTRRALLSAAAALPLAGTTGVLAVDAVGQRGAVSGSARAELLAALRAWRRQEQADPARVLQDEGVLAMDRGTLAARTRSEFRRGETIEVRGLVLSRTEVALLAALALLPLAPVASGAG